MKNLTKSIVSVMVGCAILSGCATDVTQKSAHDLKTKTMADSDLSIDDANPVSTMRVVDGPYVDTTPVVYNPQSSNKIDIQANDARLSDVLSSTAEALGYSVSFTDNTDPNKRITLSLKKVPAMDGLKKAAFTAGYALVEDRATKDLIVTDVATWVFKIDPSIFDESSSKYNISTKSSGSSGGDGGTDSEGGFTVSGESKSQDREGFDTSIRSLVEQDPKDARVTVNWTTGLITVSSDVQSLYRVKAFIEESVRQATTKVLIKSAILQVALTDSQQAGIDWSDLLDSSHFKGTISNIAGAITDAGGLSTTVTTGSVQAVIRAIAEKNSLSVLSQPQLLASNHKATTIFNGKEKPYLGKVESTNNGSNVSISAEGQYAQDGISFSAIPHVLDNENVSLKILPTISKVGEMHIFNFGNQEDGGVKLEMPEKERKQMFIEMTAKDGQTVIIGGQTTGLSRDSRNGLPGLVDNKYLNTMFGVTGSENGQEELVILVSTRIIPAPLINSVVSETL